jgi:hypothetical protein
MMARRKLPKRIALYLRVSCRGAGLNGSVHGSCGSRRGAVAESKQHTRRSVPLFIRSMRALSAPARSVGA